MSTISIKELQLQYKSTMLIYQSELESFVKDGWTIIDTLKGEKTGLLVYLVGYKKGQITAPFSTQAMELQEAA